MPLDVDALITEVTGQRLPTKEAAIFEQLTWEAVRRVAIRAYQLGGANTEVCPECHGLKLVKNPEVGMLECSTCRSRGVVQR